MSSNTKWTPGQLAYIDALCKTHHQPTYSEMAAAVLCEAQGHDENRSECRCQCCVLAERLRGIGASDE